MIVLDTNVVSEAMKPDSAPAVCRWLDDQVAETLYLTSVTVAEMLFGIGALPAGRRKQALGAALDGLLDLFAGRILSFDFDAARCYADLAIAARAAGKGFPTPDGYIAAIAVARGFVVASRDTSAFEAANVSVIDPWRAGSQAAVDGGRQRACASEAEANSLEAERALEGSQPVQPQSAAAAGSITDPV